MMFPISSGRQYKSAIRHNKTQQKFYMPGTSEEALLQEKLLKEYSKTQKMIQLTQFLQTPAHHKRKEKEREQSPHTRRRPRRRRSLSPLTLRRKYMPRPTGIARPLPAPPAAAAATAVSQIPPTPTNSPTKKETKNVTTTNRSVKLTLFKPGFEQETEEQLAQAFKRPVRKFKEDLPFYPWLPPITPLVNFKLNFKC